MAVFFTLGTNFSTEGPGLSAFIRNMTFPPRRGKTANTNTNTPMPPIQCVKLLQNRQHLDRASTSLRMEAPVVVKPEMASNMASSKRGISLLIQNGNAPKRLMAIQLTDTLTKPSVA